MPFKFETLPVWKKSLDYCDQIYSVSELLPKYEEFNLKVQVRRATTSISLNIAEGSTGQSNMEQARFLGLALRSLVETVACLRLTERRGYLSLDQVKPVIDIADNLARDIQAFRKSLRNRQQLMSKS